MSILVVKSDDDAGVVAVHHETRGEHFGGNIYKEVPEGKRTWAADSVGNYWSKYFFFSDNVTGVVSGNKAMYELCPRVARTALKKAGKTVQDIDWFVTHHPGSRILKAWNEALGFDPARHPDTLAEVGNVSICTAPFTLRRMLDRGDIRDGQLLLLLVLGSGFHITSMVWRW